MSEETMNKLITYPVTNEGYQVEIFIQGINYSRIEALEEAEKEIRREIVRERARK